MKKIFLIFILLLLSSLAMADNTLVILGDSLSAGYGIEIDKSWVNLLQVRLKEKNYSYLVINSSVSGSTTQDGLNRIANVLKIYKPQIMIIELGANDGLRGMSIAQIKQNLFKLIRLAKAANCKILLLGLRLPTDRNPSYTQAFHNVYTDLAKTENVSLVPYFLQNIDDQKNLIQEDHLHPNEEAQPIILENIWPTLEMMITTNFYDENNKALKAQPQP